MEGVAEDVLVDGTTEDAEYLISHEGTKAQSRESLYLDRIAGLD
jgi:hypothetical protein